MSTIAYEVEIVYKDGSIFKVPGGHSSGDFTEALLSATMIAKVFERDNGVLSATVQSKTVVE